MSSQAHESYPSRRDQDETLWEHLIDDAGATGDYTKADAHALQVRLAAEAESFPTSLDTQVDLSTVDVPQLDQDSAVLLLVYLGADAGPIDYDSFKIARSFIEDILARTDFDESALGMARMIGEEYDELAAEHVWPWLLDEKLRLRGVQARRGADLAHLSTRVNPFDDAEYMSYGARISQIDDRLQAQHIN